MNQPRLTRSHSLVRTLAYALRRVATPAGSLVAQVPVLELSFRLPVRSGLARHLYKASNPGRHSLLPTPGGETVRVPVVALDDRLAALGLADRPVDLIKIDIEGFELSALRGASATLSRCRNVVIEYSPDLMRQAGIEPSALIDLLVSSGMQVSMFGETGMVEVDATALRTLTGQVDLLWQRLP